MRVYVVYDDLKYETISIHKTKEEAEKAIANLLAVRKLDCYDNYVIGQEFLVD
ncbi:MAG: hypothetical protein [Cryophage ML09]|nr:MAG: hypothetical protein [Cryophage ML09]